MSSDTDSEDKFVKPKKNIVRKPRGEQNPLLAQFNLLTFAQQCTHIANYVGTKKYPELFNTSGKVAKDGKSAFRKRCIGYIVNKTGHLWFKQKDCGGLEGQVFSTIVEPGIILEGN